jgi:hypothetical protein
MKNKSNENIYPAPCSRLEILKVRDLLQFYTIVGNV